MSMNGNPHYGTSKLALQRVEGEDCWYKHVGIGPGDEAAVARAQVQATLALAHEQRTANLIAYQANVERSYHHTLTRARSGQANELNRQIIERLGLA